MDLVVVILPWKRRTCDGGDGGIDYEDEDEEDVVMGLEMLMLL